MKRSYCSGIVLLSFLVLAAPAAAQTPTPTAPSSEAARKAEAKAEADRLAKQRREQARSLLLSLASDARSFHDQTVRARTLARIADTLWDTDVERGRELFRKAWEAAGVADQEIARKRQEDIQRQRSATGGGYAIPSYPNVRGELLRLAARRDRELGEEFLQSLKADQSQNGNGGAQRMSLATDLLESDPERALQFASSELASINVSTVDFLSSLRTQDPGGADQRFAGMMNTAARNPLADANTVSLLSAYLFTPHVYISFHGGSISYSMMGAGPPPPNVPPTLQSLFFQMAANILLRTAPQSSPEQQTAGIEDQYLVMKRVLPWFEQSAPSELTNAMHARFEALGAMVRESIRQRNTDPTQRPSETESADHEQAILDQIEHAKTSAERDRLYFGLAQDATRKDDLRAHDFVSKIEDSEFRKQALAYIDVTLATHAIGRKKIELAQEMVQKGELTHIQRVWLFTQLAKLLLKTDRDRSLSLLEDAVPEARRIEGLDPDRPRALLAIANALRELDPARAWDAAFEAVKAANAAEGFTGEDGNLNILFQAKGFSSASDLPEADFDLKGIFGVLAKDDYERAVELARGFQGEAPRAAATIAIARAVLTQKIASVPTPVPARKN